MRFLAIFLITFVAVSIQASEPNLEGYDRDYYKIKDVEVKDLSHLSEEELLAYLAADDNQVLRIKEEWYQDPLLSNKAQMSNVDLQIMRKVGGLTGKVGVLLRVGKMVYSIIEKGQPISNTKYDSLHVLPEGVEDWFEMESWSRPKSRVFQVSYSNGYGMNVVKFTYRLSYAHSGTYQGRGQYLSNVQVSPVHVKVVWGYDLNAQVEIKNVQNTGTREEPVPGVEMLVSYRVKTLLVNDEGYEALYIRGDGYSEKLQ